MAIDLNKKTGNIIGKLINRIRLANTFQWQKNFSKSNLIFNEIEEELSCIEKGSFKNYEDFLFQHIGKNKFDQNNYEEALYYFNKAIMIRLEKGDQELIDSTNLAINTVRNKLK